MANVCCAPQSPFMSCDTMRAPRRDAISTVRSVVIDDDNLPRKRCAANARLNLLFFIFCENQYG